jgi:LVIVD repeat
MKFLSAKQRWIVAPLMAAAMAACGGDVVEPSLLGFVVVGEGPISEQFSSDLWVHGTTAYTGTWGVRGQTTATMGNTLWPWDVSDPAAPVPGTPLVVDARVVNDVKIRADGAIGVITHEASQDGLNGITLLDLSDPLQPTVISRFTNTLNTGVHNAWIEGDYVYLVVDGASPSSGLRILDISDPQNPTIVASFYGGSSFLHDVYVRDGLAFLSHWDAGLIVLDVGNGIAGGSPVNPVEVSRLQTSGGQTHNAWYWPATGYVFVGEEDFQTPGILHVVDASDLTNLQEVATFTVPGATPHNFWLDEDHAVLYAAWYNNGVRMLDVSGQLMGELDRQGREIGAIEYSGQGDCPGVDATCSWAPQLVDGNLYVADMNTGLWVVHPGG